MNYIKFKSLLNAHTIFSILDIKKLDPAFHMRRLNEWQSKGYIRKLAKGHYIFGDLKIYEPVLFEIAGRLYPPSYVSFESALAYYGLIPESVYGITSASTRRTYQFITPIARFYYRTLRPGLYFGYDIIKHNGKNFKIASVEKAILDYFYINTRLKSAEDFESLRFNNDALAGALDIKKLNGFLKKFGQKALTRRVGLFLEGMKNA